jgi:PmbA protein
MIAAEPLLPRGAKDPLMETRTAETALSLAISLKASAAEVFLRSSLSTSVEVKEQTVDAFEQARDIGVGLRVLLGSRMGFAYTTDLSGPALKELAMSAVTNAGNTAVDPFNTIPAKPSAPYQAVTIHDPAVAAIPDWEKIERVMAMEREAFAVDQRVRRIRKAAATFSVSRTLMMNTHGAAVSYEGTAVAASIEVVAEEHGESQAGWEYDIKRFIHALDLAAVGRRAARRAVDLLGARHIDSVKAPVVLEASVAEELLSILASGLSAENVQKKKSLFIGRLGTDVVSPLITVHDDGLLERGIGTAPADDELVPARKKTVIEQGRLALFLHNAYTAGKDRTEPTGNGIRGGFKGTPGVGVTNLYIAPGPHPPEELIAATSRGLVVTEIMGAHTANPISGDFSVGATGFWIESGKKAFPVREITIAGNILDLMKNVDAVGNDLRFSGRIGSPSLRVKELSIGGK